VDLAEQAWDYRRIHECHANLRCALVASVAMLLISIIVFTCDGMDNSS
jgi:hypothetical protein